MQTQFHLDGMHCEACERTIKQALESTAGVQRADVSLHGKTATVEFDDSVVQSNTLIKKVQDLGYGVTVAGRSVSGHA